ncbi:MAG: 4Fe-4S dicluster domain-containing protein [Cyclobacteriaceae bacterium]|jgi:formate hydrogenlyase subunit 6/NADH:ubiquinone oxidoreductase subunit I
MPIKEEGYWKNLSTTLSSVLDGLRLTGRHMVKALYSNKSTERLDITNPSYFNNQEGLTTLRYPHEQMPVPENGRYKLHNEIEDCIVCDKCVKVCPVNCITIDAIRSPEEFGKTSDGTAKRIHAAKFDIDMAKCCFCGLCTTVCPTECLTMTPDYAYSTFDIREHNFEFGQMTEKEIEMRKKEWEVYLHEKEKEKEKKESGTPAAPTAPKPVFRPVMKPIIPKSTDQTGNV